MMWCVIMQILSTALEGLWLWRKTDREKDLKILLPRRQLEIVDRARDKPLRVSRAERLTLAVLATQLKSVTGWPVKQFGNVLRLFQPETCGGQVSRPSGDNLPRNGLLDLSRRSSL